MAGLLDPTDDIVSPDERKAIAQQNLFSTLLQSGMNLVAAGENIYPWQRAQMIAQAAQPLGAMPANNQQMLANAAQQKLVAQRVAKDRRQEAADAELMKIGENPAFLDTLKQMPHDMQSIVPALFKSGRARDAVTLVDNWRTTQQREAAANAAANKLPFGWERKPDGNVGYVVNGPADPTYLAQAGEAKRPVKDIPASITKGMSENLSAMQKIDTALGSVDAKPDAVGGYGSIAQAYLPEWGGQLNNRMLDPSGTITRAQIADIGSLKIHDRSGAAVTVSETARLKPFIPSISDDPDTVRKKLANLKTEYQNMLASQHEYYSPDNGFKPYQPAQKYFESGKTEQQGSPQQRQSNGITREQYNALPSGAKYVAPDGVERRKP